MLNKVCNLNCTYCFANEFVNNPEEIKNIHNKNNISIEDFKKALDFTVKSGGDAVGIIGGEPTMHPQFTEIMETAINHNGINSVTLFTNGITLDQHMHFLNSPKVGVLINANAPHDTGDKKFELLCNSIEVLSKNYLLDKVTLGINMYKEDFEYQYIVDLLKRYNMSRVRTAIAVPNDLESRQMNALGYFRAMKPRVFEFFTELEKIKVMPTYDCNLMPVCVTTPEEKKWLMKFWEFEEKANQRCNITDNPSCSPVIDILPDLTCVRCFGMSDDLKVSIDDFDTLQEMNGHFVNSLDTFAFIIPTSDECKDCFYRKSNNCMGGCLAFKADKARAMNKLIMDENDIQFKL